MPTAAFALLLFACPDGPGECTPVAIVEHRYASQQQCQADIDRVLTDEAIVDAPGSAAECRPMAQLATLSLPRVQVEPQPMARWRQAKLGFFPN